MIQAHPFRERAYLNSINLTPSITDGVEIYNAANDDNMNALSYCYAKELGVPCSSGSDIHFFYKGPKGGMMFEEKLETSSDYARAFMARKGTPIYIIKGKPNRVEGLSGLRVPEHEPTLEVFRF
jgi:hypothetical protein